MQNPLNRHSGWPFRKGGRRDRGSLQIETLVAATILASSIGALMGLWGFGYKKLSDGHDLAAARELAKAELERAKVFGHDNLPLGTLQGGGTYATFTGVFDPFGNSGNGAWVPDGVSVFDEGGQRVAAGSAGARYELQMQIRDDDIAGSSNQPYDLGLIARRSVVVTVTRLPGRSPLLRAGTVLVKGGI